VETPYPPLHLQLLVRISIVDRNSVLAPSLLVLILLRNEPGCAAEKRRTCASLVAVEVWRAAAPGSAGLSILGFNIRYINSLRADARPDPRLQGALAQFVGESRRILA